MNNISVNSPYNYYSCRLGHELTWYGNNMYDSSKCINCNVNYNDDKKSVIRWKCLKCNECYCQVCTKILKIKTCPTNHEYKLVKHTYSSCFCDICFNSIPSNTYIWLDKKCNLGFCTECVAENEILDDYVVFED
jgi:hypothetical protein